MFDVKMFVVIAFMDYLEWARAVYEYGQSQKDGHLAKEHFGAGVGTCCSLIEGFSC